MFSYYHSPTSTPMSDVGSNIFIIGKDNFSPSHCSIGTLIKTSYSTHNIFSLEVSNSGNFSHLNYTYIISYPQRKVKSFLDFNIMLSYWWGGLELNQHSRWTADLQSVELTTCTASPCLVGDIGIEPMTFCV